MHACWAGGDGLRVAPVTLSCTSPTTRTFLCRALPGQIHSMFMEEYSWVPSIGINYIVGVDGLERHAGLADGDCGLGGVLISWSIDDRPREFYAFFMLLVAGVNGVFVAVDGFMLFFFYELAVLPMYIMIVIWGWKERREYAAMKLTLYLLIGSFISFIAMLVLYFQLPDQGLASTFDLRVWSEANFPFHTQAIWFMPLFLGFAVLAGIWPLHNWSPDGHVAAPTAVSMIHAGVLMKLGAYASMRIGIQILPEGHGLLDAFCHLLTLVNVVYGSFVAMRQTGLEVSDWLFQREPYGPGLHGFCGNESERLPGRGHSDGQPRHYDGTLLLCGRHDLRPRTHA